MSQIAPDVQFTPYGPDRFAAHLPFGDSGYLFTVPGDFPEETPAHTNCTDWEMAVYRADDLRDVWWEVRDIHGQRRRWASAGTRREAVSMAFLAIARERRIQAAQVADKRAAAGLEPVPPYQVETTNSITLVYTATTIAVLRWIGPVHETPTRFYVSDTNDGEPYEIRSDDTVTLRTTSTGIVHSRCGCSPIDAARFENEDDAMNFAGETLTGCWPCPKSPSEQQ